MISLTEAQAQLDKVMRRTGDTPDRFARRVLGMTSEQMAARMPFWGWLGAGLVLGAALTYTFAPRRRA